MGEPINKLKDFLVIAYEIRDYALLCFPDEFAQ